MSCSACQFVLPGWTCDGCGAVKSASVSVINRLTDECDLVPHSPPYCNARDPDSTFVCTRPPGHSGNHIACNSARHNISRWANNENEEPLRFGLNTICACGHKNGAHTLSERCLEPGCRCRQFTPVSTPEGLDLDVLNSTFEPGENRCMDWCRHNGLHCTAGHQGLHVAHGGSGIYCGHWRNVCADPLGVVDLGSRCSSSLVATDDVERRCVLNLGHSGSHIDLNGNRWPSGGVHDHVREVNGQFVGENSPRSSILRDGTQPSSICGCIKIDHDAGMLYTCMRLRGHTGSHCSSTDVNDTARHSWE